MAIFAVKLFSRYLFIISLTLLFSNTPVNAQVLVSTPSVQPNAGEPLLGLSTQQLQKFHEGRKIFKQDFLFGPSPHPGLGPIFNDISCATCHQHPALGGFQPGATQNVTRFGKINMDGTFDPLEHLGGSLRQKQNIFISGCPQEQIPPEANVQTVRMSSISFGSGLVGAIKDSDIVALANNPVTGGVPHMVSLLEDPNGRERVGRFGWKAQLATPLSFTADAMNNELGLSNEFLPLDQMPNALPGDGTPPCEDGIPGIDDQPDSRGVTMTEKISDFLTYLAPPPQMPKSGMQGEQIFNDIGCASCHVPSFTIPYSHPDSALRGKKVKAYSDFLLHDMGTAGDGITQGDAGGNMIKTPPLWGLIYRPFLFHNGEAGGGGGDFPEILNNTILAHAPSPEAQTAVDNYNNLSQQQKDALLAFLQSLGKREFDNFLTYGQGKEFIYGYDFKKFYDCYHQSSPISPDDPDCGLSDVDQDGDVNVRDLDSLLTVWKGAIYDCQCNNVSDLKEIVSNSSLDTNNNAIPDECMANMDIPAGQAQLLNYNNGTMFIRLYVREAIPNSQVKVYYSFKGQGFGSTLPNGFCINIINTELLGTVTTSGSGFAEITATIDLPANTKNIHFQAIADPPTSSNVKSNVATLPIPD